MICTPYDIGEVMTVRERGGGKEREGERETWPHLCVSRRDPLVRSVILVVRVGGVSADDVNVAWNDEREHLFAGPERFGFQDGWLWHLSVPAGQPHQKVHYIFLQIKEKQHDYKSITKPARHMKEGFIKLFASISPRATYIISPIIIIHRFWILQTLKMCSRQTNNHTHTGPMVSSESSKTMLMSILKVSGLHKLHLLTFSTTYKLMSNWTNGKGQTLTGQQEKLPFQETHLSLSSL